MLATEAKRCGALFIHYSTDYVFDGQGTEPWRETDPAAPLNVYGQIKLEGEREIEASGCAHFTLRTSWVYASRGGNFAKTMLRLAGEREQLTVINDQFGAPTGADLIADVTAHVIRIRTNSAAIEDGIYHLAPYGETSWQGYSEFVFEQARGAGLPFLVEKSSILPIFTSQFLPPAKRPLNSRLNTQKLRRQFGLKLSGWEEGVVRMVSEVVSEQL